MPFLTSSPLYLRHTACSDTLLPSQSTTPCPTELKSEPYKVQVAGSNVPKCWQYRGAKYAEILRSIIQLTKSQWAFYYHLAPTILNYVSNKMVLPTTADCS